jgi:hypothetical protein
MSLATITGIGINLLFILFEGQFIQMKINQNRHGFLENEENPHSL